MGNQERNNVCFVFYPYTDSLPRNNDQVICTVVCVGDIHHCNITPLLGLID